MNAESHTGTTRHNATTGLSGQVAIVTGAGRGLGRAFAQALASAGAAVAITARTADQLNETVHLIEAQGGRVVGYPVDVTDQSAMQQVVADVETQLGPVDILINNAAVLTPLGNDWEMDVDEWWRTLDINVRGPFLCTRLLLPGMIARGKGRIINVTSRAAYIKYSFGSAYCTSKAALSTMTRLLAESVKEYGIQVFALGPSGPTHMIDIVATSPKVPEPVQQEARRWLVENFGDIQESVDLLMFLLSGRANALVGRHFEIGDPMKDLVNRKEEIIEKDLFVLRRIE